jgi:Copper chaperone
MEKTMKIEGMHCKNCAASVTKALESIDGVRRATVNLEAKSVALTLSAAVEDAVLREAIDDIGFDVVEIA